MDKILNGYLILFVYLVLAALYDVRCLAVPRWLSYFAFFGRVICIRGGLLESLAISGALSLAIYFIACLIEKKNGSVVFGMGDIYIIFIIGIYTDIWVCLTSIFFACAFALIIMILFRGVMRFSEFPLAAAFLFGTLAALW